MKALAIIGASGHGKVVADAALRSGWQSVVFFDDSWPGLSESGDWQVEGNLIVFRRVYARFDGACVAIGNNAVRLRIHRELHAAGARLVTVIHPSAVVSEYAQIGSGCAIFANAVVNPFARVGHACIVNTAASIDHDCELADGVHVSPGGRLGGNVRIGEAAWIGIGASIKQGTVIGAGAIVGAGAAVVSEVSPGATVVGVPAAPVRRS